MALKGIPHSTLTPQRVAERIARAVKADKVVAFASRGDSPAVPFELSAIRAAFKNRQQVFAGNAVTENLDVRKYVAVEVEAPRDLAEVSAVLRSLTEESGLWKRFLNREFGLISYANAQGETRSFVFKGDQYSTPFPNAFRDAHGGEWSLASINAHSHPGKDNDPSNTDFSVLNGFHDETGQNRSLLVSQRRGDVLFDFEKQAVPVQPETLRAKSLDWLFTESET